jgi:hypothetical protein
MTVGYPYAMVFVEKSLCGTKWISGDAAVSVTV